MKTASFTKLTSYHCILLIKFSFRSIMNLNIFFPFSFILPPTVRNVERSLAHGTHGTENTHYFLHTNTRSHTHSILLSQAPILFLNVIKKRKRGFLLCNVCKGTKSRWKLSKNYQNVIVCLSVFYCVGVCNP